MAIGMTAGNMASMAVNSAMAVGQSQAQSMGLGKESANALAVTNLMGGDDQSSGLGPANKQEFGAAVVKATSDKLGTPGSKIGMSKNKDKGAGISPSIKTQETIIGAGLMSKGNLISSKI
jgi:hypothetical protein